MKVSLKQIVSFLAILWAGIFFDHDIYQVLLSVAAGLFTYFITLSVIRTKPWRIVFFTVFTIIFSQLAVVCKRGVMDEGFKKVLHDNPFGALVADCIYGIKHTIITVANTFGATWQAIGYDQYSSIEQLNYRFVTAFVIILVLIVPMLRHPARPVPKLQRAEPVEET
jgi:hypothetical protein